jgi:hypothetical protein
LCFESENKEPLLELDIVLDVFCNMQPPLAQKRDASAKSVTFFLFLFNTRVYYAGRTRKNFGSEIHFHPKPIKVEIY